MGCAEYHGPPRTFVACARCGKAAVLIGGEEWQCDCPPPSLLEHARYAVGEAVWRGRYRLADRLELWARVIRGEAPNTSSQSTGSEKA